MFLKSAPLNKRQADVFFINENIHVSHMLLNPQHLGGILSGLTLYRLPFDTLSEYPEPWRQQKRGSLS